jgi:hypothetical protein
LKDPKVGPQWRGERDDGVQLETARDRVRRESHAEPDAPLSASN